MMYWSDSGLSMLLNPSDIVALVVLLVVAVSGIAIMAHVAVVCISAMKTRLAEMQQEHADDMQHIRLQIDECKDRIANLQWILQLHEAPVPNYPCSIPDYEKQGLFAVDIPNRDTPTETEKEEMQNTLIRFFSEYPPCKSAPEREQLL